MKGRECTIGRERAQMYMMVSGTESKLLYFHLRLHSVRYMVCELDTLIVSHIFIDLSKQVSYNHMRLM